MRTFLWFLLIVMVSGDETTDTITTFLNESVLLPCTCENRDVTKGLKWQNENSSEVVWSDNETLISAKYRGRVTVFNNTSNICSIRLINITKDDQANYKCCFNKNTYERKYVILRVCGSEPCQQNSSELNGVFQCDVKSSDNTTKLQWTLNGKQLKNSSINSTLKDGIFLVTSTLKYQPEDKSSLVPICIVTRDSTLLGDVGSQRSVPNNMDSITVIIPVVLVLVVGLVLLVVFKLYKNNKKMKTGTLCNFWKPEGNENKKGKMPLDMI